MSINIKIYNLIGIMHSSIMILFININSIQYSTEKLISGNNKYLYL